MANKSTDDLNKKIEAVVQAHIAALRDQVHATVEQTFQQLAGEPAARSKPTATRRASAQPSKRRTSAELSELADRLYEAVRQNPGETMAVIAGKLGSTPYELSRSVSQLKADGRIRSAGHRSQTRYFPMVQSTRQAG